MALYFPYLYQDAESSVNVVTWADGTAEELAAMLAAADAGQIDLSDYWSIGDERTIAHSAQTDIRAENQVWVLMDTGANSGYVFEDDTPVHYVVGMKDKFSYSGYMSSPSTNAGSWNSCYRRTWCNNAVRASFDEDTRALFKQFKTITASENNSDTLTMSLDYFSLFAEKEIFGSNTYSRAAEANALTQIEYYKTVANRAKGDYWWERSPQANDADGFCAVTGSGVAYCIWAGYRASYFSPFGCI